MSKAPKTKMAKNKAATVAKPSKPESAAQDTEADAPDIVGQKPDVQPAPSPPAQQTGGGMGAFWGFVVVAVLGVGGYASWPYWSGAVMPYLSGKQVAQSPAPAAPKTVDVSNEQLALERRQLRESLDRLMARMGQIEKAVENVKKLAQATVPPSEKRDDVGALKDLAGRLNALEENGGVMKTLLNRMDRMEETAAAQNEADTPADASTIDEAQSKAVPELSENGAAKALLLAVANLRLALASDEPFEAALDALRELAGDNPNINTAVVLLAKNAATGISTLPILQKSFSDIAGKIVQASRVAKKSGWWDRVSNRLSSLVTWRRIDGKGKDASVDAVVASAETQIQDGDLKTAVATLGGLSVNPKAMAVAAPWLDAAKARLNAERAAASLHRHAISQMTPVTPGQG
ncbi:MAG: hypothetical protein HN377_02335 [Alphaproteobacteria bacterium]|nr:hypothetical protein [Alphaproteobacteria bacterium]